MIHLSCTNIHICSFMHEFQKNSDLKVTTGHINRNRRLDIVSPIAKIIHTCRSVCSLLRYRRKRVLFGGKEGGCSKGTGKDISTLPLISRVILSETSNCISMRMSYNDCVNCSYPDTEQLDTSKAYRS